MIRVDFIWLDIGSQVPPDPETGCEASYRANSPKVQCHTGIPEFPAVLGTQKDPYIFQENHRGLRLPIPRLMATIPQKSPEPTPFAGKLDTYGS